LKYAVGIVLGGIYVRQYILTLTLDVARGVPFILLGFQELAYLTCRVADINLARAQIITIVTLGLLWALQRRIIPYFATFYCILYLASSPNRLSFILELAFALVGISVSRWLSNIGRKILGVEPHSIIYFVYRANIGYVGLQTDFEKVIYEIPFLVLHYVCVYWKEETSVSN
jgi:hypothetical protein